MKTQKKFPFNNKRPANILKLALLGILFAFQPPTTDEFNGEFRLTKNLGYGESALEAVNYEGMAFLYENSVSSFSPWLASNLGTVKLNNLSLSYNAPVQAYLDPNFRKNLNNVQWELSGSNSLPNFTCSIDSTFPDYPDVTDLPSSISKSRSLVIHFDNLQDADFIEFMLDDNQPHVAVPWYRKIPTTNKTTLVIPTVALQDLIPSNSARLRICFSRIKTQTFSGKKFHFENRLMIVKPIAITN